TSLGTFRIGTNASLGPFRLMFRPPLAGGLWPPCHHVQRHSVSSQPAAAAIYSSGQVERAYLRFTASPSCPTARNSTTFPDLSYRYIPISAYRSIYQNVRLIQRSPSSRSPSQPQILFPSLPAYSFPAHPRRRRCRTLRRLR